MLKESVVNAFFRYEFYGEQTNTNHISTISSDINIGFLISINILLSADFNEWICEFN